MNDKLMTMLSAKIKKNYQNVKRLPHPFLYFKVKCISVFIFKFLCYNFVETLFNIDLCTHVTKYTVILNFSFSHTIFPRWRIMPL